MPPRPSKMDSLLLLEYDIAVSSAEGAPYTFDDILSNSDQGNRPFVVKTVTKYLKTGDYSIVGMEDRVTVERKSLEDLFGTVGGGRDRFEREHERMRELDYAIVVIESSLSRLRLDPPSQSKVSPKTVERTMISWMQKFGIPWLFADTRRQAEEMTFWILNSFWKNHR